MNVKELQQAFYNYFIKYYPHNSVSGIMGNISNECDWQPNLEEVGGGGGWGLIQWTGDRRTNLVNYYSGYPTIQQQFEYIRFEIEGINGVEKQWINAKGYTLTAFKKGEYSPSESALAFCWCFERPGAPDLNKRIREAERFAKEISGGTSGTDYGNIIESACNWFVALANDDSHGYDQDYRWGERGDYDCSSAVITAYTQAGIDVKGAGASYTGNMKEVFKSKGFEVIIPSDWNSTAEMKRGDVLLNEKHHTALYLGGGQIVHASINENGTATGGQPGDQTGKEIYVRDYYIYGHGWDCILRLPSSGGGGDNPPIVDVTEDNLIENIEKYNIDTVYTKVNSFRPLLLMNLSEEKINTLKKAVISCHCHMDFTWERNKRKIGVSFCGGHLTFTERQCKIDIVRRDGLVKLNTGKSIAYKFVKPKIIKLTHEDIQEIINYVKEFIEESEENAKE